jgi:hypothetical protein
MSHADTVADDGLWGLMAEFATAERLLEAAAQAHAAGYRRAQAYAPFAIDGLADALGFTHNRVPLATLLGGLGGAIGSFWLQWYSSVVDYPINVGGRPLNSWPAFLPVCFEVAVLCAVLAAVLTMLVGNRMPALTHPLFDAPDFDLAMRNRFFLVLRSDDPAFDATRSREWLQGLQPLKLVEVAR